VFHPANPVIFGKCIDFDSPGLDLKAVVKQHILESLDELGVGFVDLLLVHWPGNFGSKDKAVNRAQRKEVWGVLGSLIIIMQRYLL
jgi:aryl-alcohol dehydrogenase-like predicted oxidoreductase